MIKINLKNPLFQSPYSYLQAVGSNGSDGSASGIHLRWTFLRELGDEHLAKGNLSTVAPYITSSGFNRQNDFIKIYRIPYNSEHTVTVDFNIAPNSIVDNTTTKEWNYTGFQPVLFDNTIKTDVVVRFLDLAQYDTLKATFNPNTNPQGFIENYTGVIEIATVGKLMFKGEFKLKKIDQPVTVVKVESVSEKHHKFDEPDLERFFVSSRQEMLPMDSKQDRTIICENIERFRFQNNGAFPVTIILSTYEDHIIGENGKGDQSGAWTLVDKFSLDDGNSDNNSNVFKRLEDPNSYRIDKRWPKYNENNSTTGEFTVKIQNYKDKWIDPEGLNFGVKKYLEQSVFNPKALETIPSDDPDDLAGIIVSYLDLLTIVAFDFHVARMLGLGHIDKARRRVIDTNGGLDEFELISFIRNRRNSPVAVRNFLVENAPNSDPVLTEVLARRNMTNPTLRNILEATPILSDVVLKAMLDRRPPLSTSIIKNILVANAPLSDSIIIAALNRRPPLSNPAIISILTSNNPLSEEVLLAVLNRRPSLPPGIIKAIMIANSPLSDKLLIEILNDRPALPNGVIRSIFMENTPLSPLVENALINRAPSLPQALINIILNSNVIVGSFRSKDCIYLMEYTTLVGLEGSEKDVISTHLYMSLPTDKRDFRLPPEPYLKPVSYGLAVDNKTNNPTQLTNALGYTPYADERIVNLHRESFIFERPFESFFADNIEFNICHETHPVQYGIEYKKDTEANFRRPELNHDIDFLDHAGIPETLGIPEGDIDPLFVHQETEEGIHEYGAYSINWFSRVSPNSNLVPTDFTQFPKRVTLLPPSNFAVQLIQKEDPLIFTTQVEQDALGSLTAADKTLVRVMFDWNHMHNFAYQFANRVEFFFRQNPEENLRGKINTVTQLPNNKVQVTTASYLITSSTIPQTIQAQITPGEEFRYIGSLFSVNGEAFVVDNIVTSGVNPTFILNQIRQTNSSDPDLTNTFCNTDTFISPDAGEKFMVIENMGSNNWESQLVYQVYLENFHTVYEVELINSSSSANNKNYTVKAVRLSGANTEIEVENNINDSSATTPGDFVYLKKTRVIAISGSTLTIEGDFTVELSAVNSITIEASKASDGPHTVSSVALNANGTDTDVTLTSAINDTDPGLYLLFEKSFTVIAMNGVNKTMTLAGNLTSELVPAYRETVTHSDGTQEELLMGGIIDTATITDFEDVDNTGTPVANSKTGVYKITFDNFQLPSHINPEVDWYKGVLRVLEDTTYLPTGQVPEMKSLSIWEINNDIVLSTLELVVFDPTFDTDPSILPPGSTPQNGYVPIEIGTGIQLNFHPGYRTYLEVDTNGGNNFEEPSILPAMGEGSRQTFMAARSVDSVASCESYLTAPVILVAQEIVTPEPPGTPDGATFATRPDFYGKSTYTFDVVVNTTGGRQPYSLIFYRANERTILDKLYDPTRVQQILDDLANLVSPDADFLVNRWNRLANGFTDSSNNLFENFTTGGYRFPIPNNTTYSIPDADPTNPKVFPFDGLIKPGDTTTITLPDGTDTSMAEIVKDAINGAFLPLTEQPVIYNYMEFGTQTSGRKPTIRNEQDKILLPGDVGFDPFPMALKFNDGVDDKVRFTDYTLDGAAKNMYFYYGVELSNKLEVSERSTISGPILLVHAAPAEEPTIRKTVVQLENPIENLLTGVKFEVNDYVKSEGVRKIHIYRTNAAEDAISVRTMKMVKEVDILTTIMAEEIIDEFADLNFAPPYGDPLFYRIVALREIQNEDDNTEFVPSKPSNLVLTNIVDNFNPIAPEIRSENGTTTATTLQDVILKWNKVTHNATYMLDKLNTDGNWDELYRIKSNNSVIQFPPNVAGLPDYTTFPDLQALPRQDDEGNDIFHTFRVRVENSSGLINLTEKEHTIAMGCADLKALTNIVQFQDDTHTINVLDSGDVNQGQNNPGAITFTDLVGNALPAGHNVFNGMDITVADDAGNTHTITIATAGGTAVFNNGDGGLLLTDPNRTYTIKTKVTTDFCPNGSIKTYVLNYIFGPCNDLLQLTDLVSYTDSTQTIAVLPLGSSEINDGAIAEPVSMTFTDIVDLNLAGQTFDHMDVTVDDALGNTHTLTIATQGGSVTFNNGDGGLVLDNTEPNQNFAVTLTLFTVECATGAAYQYNLGYTFDSCDDILALTTIANYADGNGNNIAPMINTEFTTGANHPLTITITDVVSTILPVGHTFTKIDVFVEDDLGGFSLKTISVSGGNVVFNQGDGNLELDTTNPNRSYIITVIVFTDKCTGGAQFSYTMKYTA